MPLFTAPHPDWPWTLEVGNTSPARSPTSRFDWADVRTALDLTARDPEVFVALRQTDPADPKNYWFFQSAAALTGEHRGWYVVGCGFRGGAGPCYMERCLPRLEQAEELFETVWTGGTLDLTDYEDFQL